MKIEFSIQSALINIFQSGFPRNIRKLGSFFFRDAVKSFYFKVFFINFDMPVNIEIIKLKKLNALPLKLF